MSKQRGTTQRPSETPSAVWFMIVRQYHHSEVCHVERRAVFFWTIPLLPCISGLRWTRSPAEGDQEALAACRTFVRDWDGRMALALTCSRCSAPGKTGLMIGVYKAFLPRVQADLRQVG